MTSDELLARRALPLRYHISSIYAKANKVLRLVMRTLGFSNAVGMATSFKELVRLILKVPECACPVWNPSLVKHILAVRIKATDMWP